jgi:Endonuclease/Exonuclease/phosphatase family
VHYGWRRSLVGNDPRGIDVAAMSKARITVESHRERTYAEFGLFNQQLADLGETANARVFRRDALEVTTKVDDRELVVFVCHFKSMAGGRDQTMPLRTAEAKAVRRIVEERFADPAAADWLIAGDLNDYTEEDGEPVASGLDNLFEEGFAVNLLKRLPLQERWTHYFPAEQSRHQLDYLLASPALAQKNPDAVPEVVRHGQPFRVPGIEDVARYPRVGFDRPKASDHCPVGGHAQGLTAINSPDWEESRARTSRHSCARTACALSTFPCLTAIQPAKGRVAAGTAAPAAGSAVPVGPGASECWSCRRSCCPSRRARAAVYSAPGRPRHLRRVGRRLPP